MKNNDFEKMQLNLNQMKQNLSNIRSVELNHKAKKAKIRQERRAVEKKINKIKYPKVSKIAKEEQIIVFITMIIVAITFFFSTNIFAKTISENIVDKQEVSQDKNDKDLTEVNIEKNQNAIQLENILMENISVLKSKEYAEEIRELDYETIYKENPSLPDGEKVVVKKGENGKQKVKTIKLYENNQFISENILEKIIIENYNEEVVDVGTSKFLAKNKAHLEDTMYLLNETSLMSQPEKSSNEICKILKSIDVKLKKIENEEWCLVEFDEIEGYLPTKYLTTSMVTPKILEANRIQRLKMKLTKDMPLNESSGLSLEDYKKILSNNILDINHIIEDNAEIFYNIDKNYNMNGVFLASMAIHESAWGTSKIANDKKNLFGYGAYDNSPYESAFSFNTYADGIDLVAKVLVKYYLNTQGTPIYENEIANGIYYNEPTVYGVNIRYASDENWHEKVYKYMTYLYEKL